MPLAVLNRRRKNLKVVLGQKSKEQGNDVSSKSLSLGPNANFKLIPYMFAHLQVANISPGIVTS